MALINIFSSFLLTDFQNDLFVKFFLLKSKHLLIFKKFENLLHIKNILAKQHLKNTHV